MAGGAPPSSANCLLANHSVAPAQAGAYRVYRSRLTDVMDPSLRWGDGVLTFKILLSFPINRPHPEIKADRHPHAFHPKQYPTNS